MQKLSDFLKDAEKDSINHEDFRIWAKEDVMPNGQERFKMKFWEGAYSLFHKGSIVLFPREFTATDYPTAFQCMEITEGNIDEALFCPLTPDVRIVKTIPRGTELFIMPMPNILNRKPTEDINI